MADEIHFDRKGVFMKKGGYDERNELPNVERYRDELYGQFTRYISRLLESKKPKKYSSNKGLLNTRALYKHSFDENVFYRKTSIPSSDTTMVFLIDNSGSMESQMRPSDHCESMSALQCANAVVSAFAKATKVLLNNEIKIEVFFKSTPARDFDGFVKGAVPILTRVFSNTKNDTDWDKIIKTTTNPPCVTENGRGVGSLTPEFLLLPTLTEWMRQNIVTKQAVIINLTDGSVQHSFRSERCYARNQDTKNLRIKYLRGIPHLTIFLNPSSWEQDELREVYGENNSMFLNEDAFATEFFKVLTRMVDENVN